MSGIEYAITADGAQIGYRVLPSAEPRTLVYLPGLLYPIDMLEDDPPYARFLDGLAAVGRVILLERRGIGASDSLDFAGDVYAAWTEDVVAVLEATGTDRAVLVGYGATGRIVLEVAVRRPDRVSGLVVLHGGVPMDVDGDLEHFAGLGEAMGRVVAHDEDTSEAFRASVNPSRIGDPGFAQWINRGGRLGAGPSVAAAHWRAIFSDAGALRAALPSVTAPVLVLHRRDQELFRIPTSAALAAAVADGRCVVLDGRDFSPNAGDVDALVAEIARFVVGEHHVPRAERHLVALLFTDIVDSTSRLSTVGDSTWRSVLDRHDAIVRQALGRHGGRLVKATGDGVLATFDTATRALAGARDLRQAFTDAGVESRMGVHVGEVEQRGDDVSGIAVHLAARVMSTGAAGEIMTSAAVPLVAAGGAFDFEPVGRRRLKGLDGEHELWRLAPPLV